MPISHPVVPGALNPVEEVVRIRAVPVAVVDTRVVVVDIIIVVAVVDITVAVVDTIVVAVDTIIVVVVDMVVLVVHITKVVEAVLTMDMDRILTQVVTVVTTNNRVAHNKVTTNSKVMVVTNSLKAIVVINNTSPNQQDIKILVVTAMHKATRQVIMPVAIHHSNSIIFNWLRLLYCK